MVSGQKGRVGGLPNPSHVAALVVRADSETLQLILLLCEGPTLMMCVLPSRRSDWSRLGAEMHVQRWKNAPCEGLDIKTADV